MEFKVTFNGKELWSGESVDIDKLNTTRPITYKRYKVEIKTKDGEIITRYTDYIDFNDKKKEFYIEGVTFSEVDLINIDDILL